MIKYYLPLLLLAPLLIAPLPAAEEGEADPRASIQWIGKQRDEVIRLLGEPVKSKKSGKGEILIFHGPLEWFAESVDPQQRLAEVVLKPESEKPVRVDVKMKPAAASPADAHELITDSSGNPVGAYGATILAPGSGVVAIHKMKLFLDENGYVYKTKIGKQVTK